LAASLDLTASRREYSAMPGINPAILAQMGNNQAYPGSPPSPVDRTGGDGGGGGGESSIEESCEGVCAMLQECASQLDQLQGQAELQDDMDPASEKAIADAAQKVAEANDAMTQVLAKLTGQGEAPASDESGPPNVAPPA
jgi:hypothetical protein